MIIATTAVVTLSGMFLYTKNKIDATYKEALAQVDRYDELTNQLHIKRYALKYIDRVIHEDRYQELHAEVETLANEHSELSLLLNY